MLKFQSFCHAWILASHRVWALVQFPATVPLRSVHCYLLYACVELGVVSREWRMSDKVLAVMGVGVARHLLRTHVQVMGSCFLGTSFLAAEEAPTHCYQQINNT